MSNELQKSFETEIARLHTQFKANGQAVSNDIVSHVNMGRELGILLREWCESENKQGSFSAFDAFYLKHAAQLSFPLDDAKMFLAIANKLPEPAKTLADARPAFQLDMIAAGMLQVTERSGPQNANKITPMTFFSTTLGTVKEKFLKWSEAEPVETWSDDRKFMVKSELKWAAELYAKL